MKIELTKQDGITLANVADLHPYKDNPKNQASDEDYERLLAQIELGEHSPLLITEEGEVLGGNSRLRAYKEQSKKQAHVVVAKFTTKAKDVFIEINGVKSSRSFDNKDQAKAELALSHNDHINPYDPEKLKNLMQVNDLPMDVYSVATTVKPIETAVADHMTQQESSEEENQQDSSAGSGGGGDSWRECPSCGYEGEAKEFYPEA